MGIVLEGEQVEAADRILRWYHTGNEQRFVLGGYAGTGKTTLISFVRDALGLGPGEISFTAPTGKAARVLRLKGMPATTMHKLMYIPEGKTDVLPMTCEACKHRGMILSENVLSCLACGFDKVLAMEELIELSMIYESSKKVKEGGALKFVLRSKEDMPPFSLIVVDEASMVNERVRTELESFGLRVLYVGDPGQLPPVQGEGIVATKPDFVLDKIRRQAEGNSIIMAADMVRRGRALAHGRMGQVWVLDPSEVTVKDVCRADQVLCGKNATRRDLNEEMRAHRGRRTPYPENGDKMICTKNNWDLGLVNGQVGTIRNLTFDKQDVICDFEDETGAVYHGIVIDLRTVLEQEDMPRKGANAFQFAEAITVHKYQGSQAPRIALYDERFGDQAFYRRWLYTAITRAEKLLMVLRHDKRVYR